MRDYAKVVKDKDVVNAPREVRKGPAAPLENKPNWLLRLIILALVIFVGFSAWRHHISAQEGGRNAAAKKAAGSQANAPASNQNTVFDFYTVLPKGNTPSSNAATNTPPPANPAPANAPPGTNGTASSPLNSATQVTTATSPTAATSAPANTAGGNQAVAGKQYYLLIGTYVDQNAAEQVRSQLLLLGVPVAIASNGTDFRVLVGPFNDANTANQVKGQLKAQGVDSSIQ